MPHGSDGGQEVILAQGHVTTITGQQLNLSLGDFPGSSEVKNLLCNVGHVGLMGSWGITTPHALEQLSSYNNDPLSSN